MSNNVVSALDDSILITIKKLLGLGSDYTPFDMDIVVHINTVLSNLTQIGIGPVDGFYITGTGETWTSYFSNETNPYLLQQVKSYIYAKVRLLFDPPSNGNLIDSLNKIILELEYRLYTQKGGY